MTLFGFVSAVPLRSLVVVVLAASSLAAAPGKPTVKTEKTCAGVQLDDRVTGCAGQGWYYSKTNPTITAKTVVPVKMLQGRGAPTTCDMLVPATWALQVFMGNTVCDEMLQVTVAVLKKTETALKTQFNAAGNKQNLQTARVLEIKKAIFAGDMAKTRRFGELERAATFDYLLRQKTAALAVARNLDTTVQSTLKVPGGVTAALNELYKKIQAEHTVVQASIAQKVKKLQGTQPKPTPKPTGPTKPTPVPKPTGPTKPTPVTTRRPTPVPKPTRRPTPVPKPTRRPTAAPKPTRRPTRPGKRPRRQDETEAETETA